MVASRNVQRAAVVRQIRDVHHIRGLIADPKGTGVSREAGAGDVRTIVEQIRVAGECQ